MTGIVEINDGMRYRYLIRSEAWSDLLQGAFDCGSAAYINFIIDMEIRNLIEKGKYIDEPIYS